MWPNVYDHDVRRSDMRTEHEAMPPLKGRKFSANLWLHQYDFRGPNVHGCDMGTRVRTAGAAREHTRRHRQPESQERRANDWDGDGDGDTEPQHVEL